jgi:hypothetical protein
LNGRTNPISGNEMDSQNNALLFQIVMVPANSTAVGGMSVMYKDIVVPALTNLEVFFTCLILGWKDSNDPLVRINNPVLQVWSSIHKLMSR